MLKIETNSSLTNFNTFKLRSTCDFFVEINSLDTLKELISLPQYQNLPIKILGGGSNLILSERISGLVLKNNLRGLPLEQRKETTKALNNISTADTADISSYVTVASGENWHGFVCWCIDNKYFGLENLSLIPGTVGAAPIQNIGAYGVEVNKFIHSVSGVHLNTAIEKTLSETQCQFSYRNSIFKSPEYADFFITAVTFRFTNNQPLEHSYGELKEHFKTIPPSPEKIAAKVIEIRQRKLPDLNRWPNVGSFFKNPIVDNFFWNSLKLKHPELISFPYGNSAVKLSAGQLIELCGFKGKPLGAFSMYEHQALVMVNLNQGSFSEVRQLADKIISDVKNKFAISLEIEPLIW